MDELEFRRRAYANPNDTSADFIAAKASSSSHQALVAQLQHFDQQLDIALQEPVPTQLATALLRAPHLADNAQPMDGMVHINQAKPIKREKSSSLGWRHLAIAASVTFVLGFSTRFIPFSEPNTLKPISMSQVAMEHVYAESAFTQGVDERVTLTAVNAKLQPYGTELQSLSEIGHVYYANHCLFGNGPAAHLVIQGEHQRVHVFVVPPKRELVDVTRFSDERFHGEIIPMELNHLVVVGEKDENIDEMAAKIKASLHRSI